VCSHDELWRKALNLTKLRSTGHAYPLRMFLKSSELHIARGPSVKAEEATASRTCAVLTFFELHIIRSIHRAIKYEISTMFVSRSVLSGAFRPCGVQVLATLTVIIHFEGTWAHLHQFSSVDLTGLQASKQHLHIK
jgi:hypothetical protein